jgi:hypothetical protein
MATPPPDPPLPAEPARPTRPPPEVSPPVPNIDQPDPGAYPPPNTAALQR